MMYPFMVLNDGTEIVHSEMKPDGRVKVYIEKPDAEKCFLTASCYIPGYVWEDIDGFSKDDIAKFQEMIEARHTDVENKWYEYFGEINYYC